MKKLGLICVLALTPAWFTIAGCGSSGGGGGGGGGIAGLVATLAEVQTFLGGQGGILVWVDSSDSSRLKAVNFNDASPAVTVLGSHTSCINPRISPDGTRVVYSVGAPGTDRPIYIRVIADGPTGAGTLVGTGDMAYWYVDSGTSEEFVVYCDWSDKANNGSPGQTYKQKVVTGTITLSGGSSVMYAGRAMDAGPNGDGSWLGQVYDNLYAYDTLSTTEYDNTKFLLGWTVTSISGSTFTAGSAEQQTCNGSMSPDNTPRILELVIPHDWVRIFEHQPSPDNFLEVSRFDLPTNVFTAPLPVDAVEWEFPEWSTDTGYFTAVLKPGNQSTGAGTLDWKLFLVKVHVGAQIPEVLFVVDTQTSYSHLYVGP